MSDQFSVHFLSSGSSGNCTLVRDGAESFIIDFGLGPEKFLSLVQAHGISLEYWRKKRFAPKTPQGGEIHQIYSSRLTGAVLTHLHGDHFSSSTLRILLDNKVVLWVHRNHLPELVEQKSFSAMCDHGLVHTYDTAEFAITPRTRVRPVEFPHDSTATHGFVFARSVGNGARPVRFGYAADLGHFPEQALDLFANCDLLGLEFNHDVQMERNSGRHPVHISRVLGSNGHLSNEQAAQVLRNLLRRSALVKPRCLALLHISSQCNKVQLAQEIAARVLKEFALNTEILLTRQREYAGFIDLLAPYTDSQGDEVSPLSAPPLPAEAQKRPSPKTSPLAESDLVSPAKREVIIQDMFGFD